VIGVRAAVTVVLVAACGGPSGPTTAPPAPAPAPALKPDEVRYADPAPAGSDCDGAYGITALGIGGGGADWGSLPAVVPVSSTAAPPAIVAIAPPEITGDVEPTAVGAAITAQGPQLACCYARFLADHPGAAGEVGGAFTLSPAGEVVDGVAGGIDELVSSCVSMVLGRTRFPSFESYSANVKLTITFRPGR
jgi:hypothetical protein